MERLGEKECEGWMQFDLLVVCLKHYRENFRVKKIKKNLFQSQIFVFEFLFDSLWSNNFFEDVNYLRKMVYLMKKSLDQSETLNVIVESIRELDIKELFVKNVVLN